MALTERLVLQALHDLDDGTGEEATREIALIRAVRAADPVFHLTDLILRDVLDRLAARGHQVLVFTGRQEVARRFGEIGATVHEMAALQGVRVPASAKPQAIVEPTHEEHDAPVRRLRRRVKTTRVERREAS